MTNKIQTKANGWFSRIFGASIRKDEGKQEQVLRVPVVQPKLRSDETGIRAVTSLSPRFIDGRPQSEYGQKFIVAEHKTESPRLNLFEFYAVNLPYDRIQPYHEQIAHGYRISPESVIGGGRVWFNQDRLILHDESKGFGSVPFRFLEFFKEDILRAYQAKFPQIREISIQVPRTSKNDSKVAFLDELLQSGEGK